MIIELNSNNALIEIRGIRDNIGEVTIERNKNGIELLSFRNYDFIWDSIGI